MSIFSNIIDRFRTKKPASTKTVGASGARVFGGFVDHGEDSSDLQGSERWRSFSEMLANNTAVAAGTRYFLNLASAARWYSEPSDDSTAAVEKAEWLDDVLKNMTTPWHRVVRRGAGYWFWGASLAEWTATRRDDGSLGLRDIEPRPMFTIEQWDLDESGTVYGVVQRSPMTAVDIFIPRAKMVYVVDDALSDQPDGLGVFRHLWPTYKRLQLLEKLEIIGYETDLRGVLICRAPLQAIELAVEAGTMSRELADNLVKPLKDLAENHVRTPKLAAFLDSTTWTDTTGSPSNIPKYTAELLKGGGTAHAEVAANIVRLHKEIMRVMNTEQLMLGDSGTGSLALSKDKSQSFYLVVRAVLKELEEAYNADVVGPLWALNGYDSALKPRLKADTVYLQDLADLTAALVDLSQAGLHPDDRAGDVIRDTVGLPRAPEVEIMPTPEPQILNQPPPDSDEDEVPDPEQEQEAA